jgi:hypothetical protein
MTADLEPTPQELRQQAKAGRRAFASSPLSRFVRKMREVITDYLKARESGVSREDAVKGIEEVLRAEWPKRLSKFETCAGCDDSGWRLTECVHGMRCNRYRCGIAESSWYHEYVVPCECQKGDKFRRSGMVPQRSPDDDLSSVGKTKKRGGFARLGR